ncbi:hypothetical protein Dda_8341 [Drechslerella dactyloides]|uniref:ZZ-type domain-containing protein n=1 Tax=Drechslerella dactyloides TaxID=74499 RepID=A0AAD6NFR0_DREDA|nr:hypothetical protein Dda_8341 [Drechslerella dactyloides]
MQLFITQVPVQASRQSFAKQRHDGSAAVMETTASEDSGTRLIQAHFGEESCKKLRYEDYTVGWLAALKSEALVAVKMLDERHDRLPQKPQDANIYILGRIGEHNVVIARPRKYGTNAAAHTAANMVRTFNNLRFILMVGIGGGVPSAPVDEDSQEEQDIRLGDVVVGVPIGCRPSILQYDMGKLLADGAFDIKSRLRDPPEMLLNAVELLRLQDDLQETEMARYLEETISDIESGCKTGSLYRFPGRDKDNLFKSDYRHIGGAKDCGSCDLSQTERRVDREEDTPVVHYGLIASANTVMKSADCRDELRDSEGVLCFEMEAAGLMDNIPCLVIRGICDYSDDHKNDLWQEYAAVAAAAYAKDLLRVLLPEEVRDADAVANILGDLKDTVQEIGNSVKNSVKYMQDKDAAKDKETARKKSQQQLDEIVNLVYCPNSINGDIQENKLQEREKGTCEWILKEDLFKNWEAGAPKDRLLWLYGSMGMGKSVLCSSTIEHIQKAHGSSSVVSLFITGDADMSLNELLRQVAHQLLKNLQKETLEIPDYLQSFGRIEVSRTEPIKCLIHSILAMRPKTFVFIDGLDEYENYDGARGASNVNPSHADLREEGMRKFLSFLVGETETTSLRLWFSSRETPTIKEYFEGRNIRRLEVNQSKTARDISKFLQSAIPSSLTNDIEDLFVTSRLGTRALRESFLWARLVSGELRKVKDRKSLSHMLERVPETLKYYYDKAMKRIIERETAEEGIEDDQLPMWKIVLSLLAFSKRPLRIAEVKDGVAMIRTGALVNLDSDYLPYPRSIEEACMPFVKILAYKDKLEDDYTIMLSHSAVKQFLLARSDSPAAKKISNNKEILISREIIGTCCLNYLSQPKYSKLLEKRGVESFSTSRSLRNPENIRSHHFLSYAAKYWHQHFDTPMKVETLTNAATTDGPHIWTDPTPDTKSSVTKFLHSTNFATCIQVQSLCVSGHFIQSYDSITDKVKMTKRVLPNWLYTDRISTQYGDFIDEWGELLQCGGSKAVSGELDRCLWNTLGGGHLLSWGKSRYHSFGFREEHVCQEKARGCRIQRLSSNGKKLISCLFCVDKSGGELYINTWDLETPKRPRLESTGKIDFKRSELKLDEYGEPCSTILPLIPNIRCLMSPNAIAFFQDESLVRVGSKFFNRSRDGSEITMSNDSLLVDTWEEISSRGTLLIASRRRVRDEKPSRLQANGRLFWPIDESSGSDYSDDFGDSEDSWSEPSTDADTPGSDESIDSESELEADHSGGESSDGSLGRPPSRRKPRGTLRGLQRRGQDSEGSEESDSETSDETDSNSEDEGAALQIDTDASYGSADEDHALDSDDSDDSIESADSMDFDSDREAQALRATTDNPYPIRIGDDSGYIRCDRCNRQVRIRWYRCLKCPIPEGAEGNFDLCRRCEKRGFWCKDKRHPLYDMLNDKAIGVISKAKFSPRNDLHVYDTSAAKPKLLYKYSRKHGSMLYESPPVAHPVHDMVVWALNSNKLLFVDIANNSRFEQKISSTGHRGRPICVNLSFSKCGTLLRVAKIEAVTLDVPDPDSKNRVLKTRLCWILHLLVFQLSAQGPTKFLPKLLGTTSLDIGRCERSLVGCLPFAFTWGADDLYITISSSRLRVYCIDIAKIAAIGKRVRDKGKSKLRCNGVEGMEESGKGLVLTPKEIVFLPRSARNRTVQYIPPAGSGRSDVATVIVGPKHGEHSLPGFALYLSRKDLGDWVDINEKAGEDAKLFGKQKLKLPYEEFDVQQDCDIIPAGNEKWYT